MPRMMHRRIFETEAGHRWRRRGFRQEVKAALVAFDLSEFPRLAVAYGLGITTAAALAVWSPRALLIALGLVCACGFGGIIRMALVDGTKLR